MTRKPTRKPRTWWAVMENDTYRVLDISKWKKWAHEHAREFPDDYMAVKIIEVPLRRKGRKK